MHDQSVTIEFTYSLQDLREGYLRKLSTGKLIYGIFGIASWILILLALVGLNPLIFHTTIYRRVHEWEVLEASPWRARAAAIASLTLWSGVIISGRLIAYF